MKSINTKAEAEQFARDCQSLDEAKGWPAKNREFYLSRAQFHVGKGGTMPAAAANFALPPKVPLPPLTGLVAPVPARPVVVPVPAAVVADRVRAMALMAMTAKGADAQAKCQAAIRSGADIEEYRATVAARSIIDAMSAARR